MRVVAQRAERDRVAELARGRDVVLPAPADIALQCVRRTGRELDRDRRIAIGFRGVGAKAHARRARERDTDDQLEMRRIAVPPDRRTGRYSVTNAWTKDASSRPRQSATFLRSGSRKSGTGRRGLISSASSP